jgi:uncharacterized protein YggE
MLRKLQTKEGLMGVGSVFLIVLTLFVLLMGVGAVVSFGLLNKDSAQYSNVITVSGTGEAYAVPDVATFSFTARNEAKDVATAQSTVNQQIASVLGSLKDLGVEDKDIKTTSVNSYPQYEWQTKSSFCIEGSCPRPDQERVLVGYEHSQTTQVKVRNLDLASNILTILGEANVDSFYGPNFEVDDDDAVLTAARKDAIVKAEAKAEELADQLGVRLGKVISFSEGGSGGEVYPVARAMMAEDAAMGGIVTTQASLPAGENKVTATVSITYKIK